jgi:hypothetical protein
MLISFLVDLLRLAIPGLSVKFFLRLFAWPRNGSRPRYYSELRLARKPREDAWFSRSRGHLAAAIDHPKLSDAGEEAVVCAGLPVVMSIGGQTGIIAERSH